MKKTFKTKVCSVLTVALFLLATGCYAQDQTAVGKEKKDKSRHEQRIQKLVDELGLTDEQQEAMKNQRQEHWQELKDVRQKLQTAREALKEELDKYDSDNAKINSLANEIKTLEGKMVDFRIQKVLSLKEILTAEQYQKFQEATKNFHNRAKQRFDKKLKNRAEEGEQ